MKLDEAHPLAAAVIWVDPERLSGAACFRNTRVPVSALFDYLEGEHSIAEFLDDFPPVTREQVDAVLQLAESLITKAIAA